MPQGRAKRHESSSQWYKTANPELHELTHNKEGTTVFLLFGLPMGDKD
jgi:hypothetical protein